MSVQWKTHNADEFQCLHKCASDWPSVTEEEVARFKFTFGVTEPCAVRLLRDINPEQQYVATKTPASKFYAEHLASDSPESASGFLVCDGCNKTLTTRFEQRGELLPRITEIYHCETTKTDLCKECFDPTLLKSFILMIQGADGMSIIGVYSVSLHSPPTQASASETVPAAKRARTTTDAADDASTGLPPAAKRARTTTDAAAADDAATGLPPAAKRARTTTDAAAADDAS